MTLRKLPRVEVQDLALDLHDLLELVRNGQLDKEKVKKVVVSLFDQTRPRNPILTSVDNCFELSFDFGPAEEEKKKFDGKEFRGEVLIGTQTRRFVWVQIGQQPNIKAVCAALTNIGRIPSGLWLEAILEQFDAPGDGLYGIADPSWFIPTDHKNQAPFFPYILHSGKPNLGKHFPRRGPNWRWLIQPHS